MPRGSNKKGPQVDDHMKHETEPLERSGKGSRAEEARDPEPIEEGADRGAEPAPSGHRIAGTGSSADRYSYTDHGEEGGASHPKPHSED